MHDLLAAKQTRERIFLYTEKCDKKNIFLTYVQDVG